MLPPVAPSSRGGNDPLRGTVVSGTTGNPVDTADVRVFDRSGRRVASAVSAVDGRFTTGELPASDYRVQVTASGYFLAEVAVSHPQAATPVRVELQEAELTGRVVSGPAREPVLDAKLQLRASDGRLVGQAVTDPSGRFIIPLVDAVGSEQLQRPLATLHITADSFAAGAYELELPDRPSDGLEFTLEPVRRPWALIAGGVVAALIAAVALVVALSGDDTQVPDLLTATVEQAAGLLADAELNLGEVSSSESDAEPGTIVEQSVDPGETVSAGSAVDVVVAGEADEIVVPNLVGLSQPDAQAQLDELGLTAGELTERDSTESPAGTVLATDPGAGQVVEPGAAVGLVLAVATEQTIEVPNLSGRQERDALRLLDDQGFDVSIFRTFSDEREDTVVGQDPAAGDEVLIGSSVAITVSEGPEPASEPEPSVEPDGNAGDESSADQGASESETSQTPDLPEQMPSQEQDGSGTEQPQPNGESDDADSSTSPSDTAGADGGDVDDEGGFSMPEFSLPEFSLPTFELPEFRAPDIDVDGLGERISSFFRDLFSRN